MDLNPLEEAVLRKLLDGDHLILQLLRQQLKTLHVKTREWTGAGFYTEFSLSPEAVVAPVPSTKLRFGDVEATINGLNYGAGFVLYIDNGLLHMLEGYSYEEPWPETIDEFSVRYSAPDRKAVSERLG